MVVLDIGANQGGFVEQVIAHRPGTKVYAFEPIPEMIQQIEMISKAYPDVVAVPVALGEQASVATFHVHAHIDASSLLNVRTDYKDLYPDQAAVLRNLEVRVERLDDWAVQNDLLRAGAIDLVKIDVQGYEGQVIAGGPQVLRATRYLVAEAALYPSYAGGIMLDELAVMLGRLGFELIWVFNVYSGSCYLFYRNKALTAP